MQTERRSVTRGGERGKTRKPNLALKGLRRDAGLSQRRLGYLAGVSQSCISLAEKGWIPHPASQYEIAKVLKTKPTSIWPVELKDG